MTPYITTEEAQTYFNDRLHTEAWDDATVTEKGKAGLMATRVINNLNISGTKTDNEQDNEFPRGDDVTIPVAVQEACAEIMLALLDGIDPDLEFDNLNQVSQGYAGIRSTYNVDTAAEHKKAGIPSIIAWRLLLPFLRDSNTFNISRVS